VAQLVLPAKWLEQETPLSVQRQWLSLDEHKRFQELHQHGDRLRMLAGRFVLRQCLREFYGLSQVRFSYGKTNKPFVAQPVEDKDAHAHPIDVNLTHDRQHVLAAFNTTGDVGVDVASLLDFTDWQEFAADYLTADEVAWVRNARLAARPLRALRLWTLKEAVLKSTGHGLDIDPREIVLCPGSRFPIVALPRHLPPVSVFGLHEWQIDTQTYAALASVTASSALSSGLNLPSASKLRFVEMSAKPLMPAHLRED
jgi:phosphopantetheinyl transferase